MKKWWTVGVTVVLAALHAACGGRAPTLEELVDDDDCRRSVVVGHPAEAVQSVPSDTIRAAVTRALALDWRLPAESVEVVRLNAWCAAVGPAVVGGWGDGLELDLEVDAERLPETTSDQDSDHELFPGFDPARPLDFTAAGAGVDTVWVVSWNLRVGGGDLRRLVSDLRSGRLTSGHRPGHFILALQEAYRAGDLVPPYDPARPGGSGIAEGPPEGSREDIVALAQELGLWLVYAPSMRNGESEDRGNALLSTLPLESPVAIGLPVARQRRVAIAAELSGRTRAGEDWRLQVATVHLESAPTGWSSDEAQRLAQAETLVSLLPDAEAAIAAGDFNTKIRAQDEALVGTMLQAYPDTPPFPTGPTYRRAFGFYREYLDYIFYRLPDGASGRYARVPSLYGSDHYPLVGWVAW